MKGKASEGRQSEGEERQKDEQNVKIRLVEGGVESPRCG